MGRSKRIGGQVAAACLATASRAVALIQGEEEALGGRTIPYWVLLTRTSPIIASRIEREIVNALAGAELSLLKNRLNERQVFKAIFVGVLPSTHWTGAVNGLSEALANAQRLAVELIDL